MRILVITAFVGILCLTDGIVFWERKAAAQPTPTVPSNPPTPVPYQRGAGAPYEIAGSQVWDVPDPASGRDYQVFVQLPASYGDDPARRYPVLFVTDADYAFPVIRQISRRMNLNGPVIEEFILVGLSYAKGDDGAVSRNRDYTPTANGPSRSRAKVHGGAAAYQAYLSPSYSPALI
ncbi:MAG: hypothetical protein RLY86_3243 [Pseudomonadota bacterium]|jgi:hypothetical protein